MLAEVRGVCATDLTQVLMVATLILLALVVIGQCGERHQTPVGLRQPDHPLKAQVLRERDVGERTREWVDVEWLCR